MCYNLLCCPQMAQKINYCNFNILKILKKSILNSYGWFSYPILCQPDNSSELLFHFTLLFSLISCLCQLFSVFQSEARDISVQPLSF